MVKVGVGKNGVLMNGTLILNDEEVARIEIPLPLWAAISTEVVRLELRFTQRSNAETDVKWRTEDGVVKFDFIGWKTVMEGTALLAPVAFGCIVKAL
jgi:hypothetical protein